MPPIQNRIRQTQHLALGPISSRDCQEAAVALLNRGLHKTVVSHGKESSRLNYNGMEYKQARLLCIS